MLENTAKISDIIAALQELEGINQKADLKSALIAKGINALDTDSMADLISKLNSAGATITEDNLSLLSTKGVAFWTKTYAGQFYDIATDSQGSIYVVRNVYDGTPTLIKYDTNGNIIWSNSTVSHANVVCVDSSDNVYVASYTSGDSTGKLAKFDSSGTLIWSVTNSVYLVISMKIDSSGNVYIGTGGYSTSYPTHIAKFNSSGALIWSKTITADSGQSITDMALDNSGNIYTINGSPSIYRYDTNGNLLNTITLTSNITNIELDSSGNIYVGGQNANASASIKSLIKLNGTGTEIWSKTGIRSIVDLKLDKYNNIYVTIYASSGSRTLSKFNSSGTLIWSTTPDLGRIALDNNSDICGIIELSGQLMKVAGVTKYQIISWR